MRHSSRRRLSCLLAVVLAAGVCAARVANAQDRATSEARDLEGMVFDETGGFMPNVDVTLKTGAASQSQKTDDTGRFRFTAVAPGDHWLEAARPGFVLARQELKLQRREDWQRTITLVVGTLSETVTIVERRHGRPAVAPTSARGGSVRPPRRKTDARLEYPAHLRAAGVEADVRLEAIVAADGTVAFLRPLDNDIHPDFIKAAMECVAQWTYEPTRLNGKPIGVFMTVVIRFRLE